RSSLPAPFGLLELLELLYTGNLVFRWTPSVGFLHLAEHPVQSAFQLVRSPVNRLRHRWSFMTDRDRPQPANSSLHQAVLVAVTRHVTVQVIEMDLHARHTVYEALERSRHHSFNALVQIRAAV